MTKISTAVRYAEIGILTSKYEAGVEIAILSE